MAIALVGSISHQTRVAFSTDTTAITIQSTTAGSLLVYTAAFFSGAGAVLTGITGAGTWSAATISSGDSSSHVQIWYAPNVSGSVTSLTVSRTSTGTNMDLEGDVLEFSAAATSTPLDQDVNDSATTSSLMTTVFGELSQADEVLINIGSHTGADATLSADTGAGWTLISTNPDNDSGQTYLSQYLIVSATTALSPTIDYTGNRDWFTAGASFKGSGGGAATNWGLLLGLKNNRLVRTG
jgi:hypothetical protein